jgi:nucleoside phosphorylase
MAHSPPDLAVLFALRREARPLLREFLVREEASAASCKAWFCRGAARSVLVVETGVGQERMEHALDWLLGKPPVGNGLFMPKLIVSAGISGSLRDELRVGDIVVATEVIGPDGVCHSVTSSEWGNLSPQLRRGRLVTVDRPIADPAEKRVLGRRYDALAVDMETAAVGRRCRRACVPFACIRAISDDTHAPLSPELGYIIDNGRVSLGRLTASLLRRPRLAAELWRLARDTQFAAERLGETLRQFLELV